jgi:hypothetical protein
VLLKQSKTFLGVAQMKGVRCHSKVFYLGPFGKIKCHKMAVSEEKNYSEKVK